MKILILLLTIPAFANAIDCAGKPDGRYETGCKSYAECTNGVGKIVECRNGTVFDNNTGACNNPTAVTTICGKFKDCTGKGDGKYSDTETQCKTYYTCYKGDFLNHNLCTGGLVFDEAQQTCNWPPNVNPPCGTKGTATTAPNGK